MDWFPQNYAHDFYVAKGIIGVIAVILLLWHMSRSWDRFDPEGGIGQRLRYLTLFYFAVLATSASVEQIKQNVVVNYRSLGAIGGATLLVVTAVVSLSESSRKG